MKPADLHQRTPTPVGPQSLRLLGYNPSFDGLRALAVVAVALYHFAPFGWAPGGWVGVDLFFALSGFLITSMLLTERARTGSVSLARFHARRLLRLQPALLTFLAVWLAAAAVVGRFWWFRTVPGFPLGHSPPQTWGVRGLGALSAVFDFNNWLSVANQPMPPIGHLWSLSIEGQFYLVWPVLLLLAIRFRPRWTVALTGGLAVLSGLEVLLLFRGGAGSNHIYFGTDTRAQALLLGALGAQLWSSGRLLVLERRPGLRRTVAGLAGALLVLVTLFDRDGAGFQGRGGLSLVDLASALVVAGLATGPGRALSGRALVWLGRRSYAIYLWSYVFATWLHPLGTWAILLGLPASCLAAQASWVLVERRALGLRSRLATTARVG